MSRCLNKRSIRDDSFSDGLDYLMDDDDDVVVLPTQQQPKKFKTYQPAASSLSSSSSSIEEIDSNVRKLPPLTHPQQHEVLRAIERNEDKNLQMLFWELGCNFVLHEHQFKAVRMVAGVQEDFPRVQADTRWATMNSLANAKPRDLAEKGLLVADVMGLGKTIQAVLACLLRNRIAASQGKPRKPTLICSPNESVLSQWHEHLILAGIDPNKIYRFKTKQGQPISGDIYVLCNRYDFQTEARWTFQSIKPDVSIEPSRSPLYPNARSELLAVLKNQYRASKGKEKNRYIAKHERTTINECIVKHLARECRTNSSAMFRTVVIDEAHFLKSLKTLWGMAAALLGLHTERMLPMTGTPYNNSCQDIASLMTFINPTEHWAAEKWWKRATENGDSRRVAQAVAEWSSTRLLRRDKDVIADKLPGKAVRKVRVSSCPVELKVYEEYEQKLQAAFGRLKALDSGGTGNTRLFQQSLEVMLRTAACCRMALIHPILPGGGREITVFFSPSRCNMKSVRSSLEKPNLCVCCKRKVQLRCRRNRNSDTGIELGAEDDDDLFEDDKTVGSNDNWNVEDDSEAEEEGAMPTKFKTQKGRGPIVPIPTGFCQLAARGVRHFACESCLDELEESGSGCPRCVNLFGRLDYMKSAEGVSGSGQTEGGQMTRKLYCKETFGGFRTTAKLDSVLSDFKSKLPRKEKVLIASFFKGTLDLLEAMFAEMQVQVARFDGDIKADEREKELNRFKLDDSCRVLLMTVQTGGTGLNLVVANHVWFVDRFWNPMVMEQCEDRCFRLGQKREVDVAYHDVQFTIDDVMHHINLRKMKNAAVILADGTKLSTSGLSFKDLSGKMGEGIGRAQEARERFHQLGAHSERKPSAHKRESTSASPFAPLAVSNSRRRGRKPSKPLRYASLQKSTAAAQDSWARRTGFDTLDGYKEPTQPLANQHADSWAERTNFAALLGEDLGSEEAYNHPQCDPSYQHGADGSQHDQPNNSHNDGGGSFDLKSQLRELTGEHSLENSVAELLLGESHGNVMQAASLYRDQQQQLGRHSNKRSTRAQKSSWPYSGGDDPEVIVLD
ncbi:regulator of chromatin subfamily A containing DEAD/H box 1 [Seminavis robusta]|uniref:Regulator of chromatin subfamily A containing DEAD/H box 1 n=1 Tax=Seminavis robusta TaxID=568900 RepID=A0A9N8EK15_9STRA|nr:regulator of chromatin subfamily A containing DEAD/H box 1 [Seminavis robusta]|eukprot:Sro1126_g244090.1 regulator of chromatin subfamily A containing DEAD/H box 1 (1068) ;mRNA; r:19202-22853